MFPKNSISIHDLQKKSIKCVVGFVIFVILVLPSFPATIYHVFSNLVFNGTHTISKTAPTSDSSFGNFDYLQYVNVDFGTTKFKGGQGYVEKSIGNQPPLFALPFSMALWSITTSKDSRWWFAQSGNDLNFFGIRCTNQPSPWIGDFGQFNIRIGRLTSIKKWNYKNANFVDFVLCKHQRIDPRSCANVTFSPSAHGGILEVTLTKDSEVPREINVDIPIQNSFYSGNDKSWIIQGLSKKNQEDASGNSGFKNDNFSNYFSLFIEYDEKTQFIEKHGNGIRWTYTGEANHETLRIRIATSFIGWEQAKIHLYRELAHHNVDTLSVETAQVWNSAFNRIEVETEGLQDTKEALRKRKLFYTCFYRALLFPRNYGEKDENDIERHYSPNSREGSTFTGPLSSSSGFWDSYRTVYPFLHLVFPDEAKTIFSGWINQLKENEGRLPQWNSPGSRKSMPGTLSDVSLSEAILKGAITDPKDVKIVYDSLIANAFSGYEDEGRSHLEDFIEDGYIPKHHLHSVSLTLQYALSDFSIAQVAKIMEHPIVEEKLLKRAENWKNIFNKENLFFQAKSQGGDFGTNFDPLYWNNDYTEAGPWQYRFYVPHDPRALNESYGGEMCNILKESLTTRPSYRMDYVIHEASEMRHLNMGQYSHNNQPSHHILYMFAYAGNDCPLLGQAYIQEALQKAYDYESGGFSGDEDNGEMASWYLLSSVGLYALMPSIGTYQVGAPSIFSKVIIRIPKETSYETTENNSNNDSSNPKANMKYERDFSTLVIKNTKFQKDYNHKQSLSSHPICHNVQWNGQRFSLVDDPVEFEYKDLLNGGEIVFY